MAILAVCGTSLCFATRSAFASAVEVDWGWGLQSRFPDALNRSSWTGSFTMRGSLASTVAQGMFWGRQPALFTAKKGFTSWVSWVHALSKVETFVGSHCTGTSVTVRPLI